MIKRIGKWIVMKIVDAEAGNVNPKALITMLVLAFIGLMFIGTFTPVLESSVGSDNVTNATTGAFLDLSVWLIPVGATVGIILTGVAMFKGKNGD